jgi:hypothetical protein
MPKLDTGLKRPDTMGLVFMVMVIPARLIPILLRTATLHETGGGSPV